GAIDAAQRARALMQQRKLPCHAGAWVADRALADALQAAGRFDEARTPLQAIEACHAPQIDETPMQLAAQVGFARDALARNDAPRALSLAEAALASIAASSDRVFYADDAAEAQC